MQFYPIHFNSKANSLYWGATKETALSVLVSNMVRKYSQDKSSTHAIKKLIRPQHQEFPVDEPSMITEDQEGI